jgi:hypothetical protein
MSAECVPQQDFVADFWKRLVQRPSIEVVELPGSEATSLEANQRLLGIEKVTSFKELLEEHYPCNTGHRFYAEQELEGGGIADVYTPPTAVIRLGDSALLAIVEDDHERRISGRNQPSGRTILSLEHDKVSFLFGLRHDGGVNDLALTRYEVQGTSPGLRAMRISRPLLAQVTDYEHPTVSWEHVTFGPVERGSEEWVLHDLGSRNGTQIAMETTSLTSG